jgi:hypothetical protein
MKQFGVKFGVENVYLHFVLICSLSLLSDESVEFAPRKSILINNRMDCIAFQLKPHFHPEFKSQPRPYFHHEYILHKFTLTPFSYTFLLAAVKEMSPEAKALIFNVQKVQFLYPPKGGTHVYMCIVPSRWFKKWL